MTEHTRPGALVPHRGPALLVEEILESGPDFAICRGRVPSGSAFAHGTRAPAVLALELAAQAAAVHLALSSDGAHAGPRPGYLVGVREATLRADDVPTDQPLVAIVRRVAQSGPLAVYDVSVTAPGIEPLLTATLSTHAGG